MEAEDRIYLLPLRAAELFMLSEYMNNEAAMDDAVYDRISKKVLVAAAKAGLYDETEWE